MSFECVTPAGRVLQNGSVTAWFLILPLIFEVSDYMRISVFENIYTFLFQCLFGINKHILLFNRIWTFLKCVLSTTSVYSSISPRVNHGQKTKTNGYRGHYNYYDNDMFSETHRVVGRRGEDAEQTGDSASDPRENALPSLQLPVLKLSRRVYTRSHEMVLL